MMTNGRMRMSGLRHVEGCSVRRGVPPCGRLVKMGLYSSARTIGSGRCRKMSCAAFRVLLKTVIKKERKKEIRWLGFTTIDKIRLFGFHDATRHATLRNLQVRTSTVLALGRGCSLQSRR